MTPEWSHYYRPQVLGHELEVLHARFVGHRFARHTHDYFAIGYVESGVQAFACLGVPHVTPARHVFLVNPGEAHTGQAATPHGYVYRTLYPTPSLVQAVAGGARLPQFARAVVHDARLPGLLAALHRGIAGPSLATETRLVALLEHLLGRYADHDRAAVPGRRERRAVRRGREYIDAHFADDVTLAQLAAAANLSPSYFARSFERDVGLPPHAYLEAVRIARARELLRGARSLAEVALAVGYSDQSHFTHRFKRLLGITPNQYRRCA